MFPPRSILAGVDFSEQSRGALMLAALIARRCGARLHVVYAEEPRLAEAAARGGVDLAAECRTELARFAGATPGVAACAPEQLVNVGRPATVLLHAACRMRADLTVLGARGMSGAGRFLFGSVAESVLLQSAGSVLVVPDWWASLAPALECDDRLGPLVVGIDFSEPSVLALHAAIALAGPLQAGVEAVHVVPDLAAPEAWKRHAEEVVAAQVAAARADLTRLVAQITSPVHVSTRVERGGVVEQLIEAAMPLGDRNPLLVVGRRGTRSKAGIPGAIAYRLASMTRVPVLMHRELAD
ncbi:MAG: universal stress protein [Vicinamibacterales bacterium]